jgi:hypothetical protein
LTGVVFPPGTRSVLYFGKHGLGDYCYGTGGSSGGDCYDPDSTSQGTHAYPYRSQVWAYDANELVAVKNGTKNAYDVVPYAVWNLDASFKDIQGVGYDAATRRLYISQTFGDGEQPLIRVYQVAFSAPMQILTSSLPDAVRFRPYNQAVQASGGSGSFTWSLSSGTLPPGMVLDAATGFVRGRARLRGSWTFTLTAVDSQDPDAVASRSFTVRSRLQL